MSRVGRLFVLAIAALIATASLADAKPPPKNSAAAYKLAAQFSGLIGRCWFAKGETAFAGYQHASETNAIAGPPRVLLVEKKAPHGRPALVIEFRTTTGDIDVSVYGPLAATAKAARIGADLRRWVAGGRGCG
jgi:hypothetical protein